MPPDILGTGYSALFGLFVGSFLNVCIDRLPRDLSIVSPPSHCDSCGRRLGPLELVPLLSFFWLRGRCRRCRAPIGARVPLVEAATGLFFALAWLRSDGLSEALVMDVWGSLLLVVLFIDLEHQLILNKIIYPWAPLALALSPLLSGVGPLRALLGGLTGLGIFLAIFLLARDNMGFGDVKFALVLGLLSGFPRVLVAVLLSAVTGGVVAGALLVAGRKGRRDPIPFGPFLAIGGLVTMLWGADLWAWYRHYL